MGSEKIKILLADDSGWVRLLIRSILSEEIDLEVIATAENGQEALQKVQSLEPQVVILDLLMADYDGIYAVEQIMAKHPKPIIILTALAESAPHLVIEALEKGAYDFIPKPAGNFQANLRNVKDALTKKVRLAAHVNLDTLKRKRSVNNHPHSFGQSTRYDVILIGASTGGTTAIETILLKLPTNLPIPILIAQHIPQDFGLSYSDRLNELTPFPVHVAQNRESIKGGFVYLAPSNCNTTVRRAHPHALPYFEYSSEKYQEYNFPSVDALMLSAAEVYQEKTLAVVLTGMGRDGTLGMQQIRARGGFNIAQNEESSVVFGMPKSAIERGVVHQVLPLKEIANFIVSCL